MTAGTFERTALMAAIALLSIGAPAFADNPPTTPATATAITPSTKAGAPKTSDPCALLDSQTVAQALGVAIDQVAAPTHPTADECLWAAASHAPLPIQNILLTVKPITQGAKLHCKGFTCLQLVQSVLDMTPLANNQTYATLVGPVESSAVQIAGLGNKAMWANGALTVLASAAAFQLKLGGSADTSQYLQGSEDLAKLILSRMGQSGSQPAIPSQAIPGAAAGWNLTAAVPQLLAYDFSNHPDGLITNEYAFEHPTDPNSKTDPTWELTSGSFLVQGGRGYSGVPDHVGPNASSSNGTNSAVFRARTKRSDFGDVAVTFDLEVERFYDNTGVPPHSYDGVHVWLRYQSEYSLYAVTVSRRDNIVVVKKKAPGGPSNGGTYYELASQKFPVALGKIQHIEASAHDNADGSVAIVLTVSGRRLLSVRDDGSVGGPAISHAGRVGIRGDNCEFYVANFTVNPN